MEKILFLSAICIFMLQACSSPTSRNYDGGKSKTKPEEVTKPKKVHIAKYNYAPRSRVSKIMSDHGLLWSGLREFAKEFTNDEALSLVKYFTKREKYETRGRFLPMDRFLQRIMLNTKSEEAQFIMINKVPHFIMYAENPSERIQLASINQGYGEHIQYIRNPTEKVQLAAINKSVTAFKYITNPTDKVRNHPKVLADNERRVQTKPSPSSTRSFSCTYTVCRDVIVEYGYINKTAKKCSTASGYVEAEDSSEARSNFSSYTNVSCH